MLMKNNLPYICMVVCNIIFAGMALFAKAVISKGMNPYIFGAYRQAFATLALAPFAFYLERITSAMPMSFMSKCLFNIFLVVLIMITLCINLLNVSFCYVPATFASATTNTIPAITFIIAILLRMESVAITEWSGVAKVLGTMLCVGGAAVYSFVKGPLVYPQAAQDQNSHSYTGCGTKAQCLKGSLFALSAQGPLTKIYPDKLRLTTIQCFFSCIQLAIWALAVERNISAWKLGWDLNLLVVAYCGVIFVALTYWLRIWVIEKRGPVFFKFFLNSCGRRPLIGEVFVELYC
ncbi:hypothetical protein CsSME_00034935 [Camellia sinensis var. sinensis]